MSKVRGSVVLSLIIVLSIVSISILAVTSITIRDNNIYSESLNIDQCRYIAQGYRDIYSHYYINEELHKYNTDIKLFEELDYDINIKVSDEEFNTGFHNLYNIPTTIVTVNSNYKGHSYNSFAYITKFNRILFTKDGVIEKGRIKDIDYNRYINLVDKINNYYDSQINNPSFQILSNVKMQRIRSKVGLFDPITDEYVTDLKSNNVVSDSLLEIGSEDSNFPVSFAGIFYNKGKINLNTDFRINGIFISKGGSVNDNGNNIIVNGVFIELGDTDIKENYPRLTIKSRLDMFKYLLEDTVWANNREVLYLFDYIDL